MENNNKKITVTLPSVGSVLLISLILLILKLTGIIHWGWIWIISPIWLPYVFAFVISLIILIIYKITGRT